MKKRWPFVLVGVVLLLGIIGSLLVLRRPDTSLVEIVQDGRVLYQIDLAQAEDQTIEVEYEGRGNIIEIKAHRIHVLEAECPDKTCVNMGWLNSSMPIVCLPNRLVIQFVGDSDALDGTTG